MGTPAKDLTALRFGRLVALLRLPRDDGQRHSYWECICDCGTICAVRTTTLVAGITKSCGSRGCKGHPADEIPAQIKVPQTKLTRMVEPKPKPKPKPTTESDLFIKPPTLAQLMARR